MNSTAKLLIVYDYFFPAYKAGGPIQSLTNLVLILQEDDYKISVVTSGHDLNTSDKLQGIKTNVWSEIFLPQSASPVDIWYGGINQPSKQSFIRRLQSIKPSVVYLNGMFSFRFVIIPLLSIKKAKIKLVLCPRGMLQSGALAGKSFKKRLYLSALKISGLVRNITWHATNKEEEEDIKRIFGKRSNVIVAGNIPKKPLASINSSTKIPGHLKLIYLSLITEKKNLLQLVEIISKTDKDIFT